MLTQRQFEIYENLLKYTKEGEVFFASDQLWKDRTYRIFSYRLGAYMPFMQPDALEGRGIMFELDEAGNPVRLAARPMHKFFNLNENPATMNLNIANDNIEMVMDKVDGSLISTWIDHEGELQFKSKTSLHSDQVQMAWNVVNTDKWIDNTGVYDNKPMFAALLKESTETGWTVNLEYIGPDNRIVIGYERQELRVLNFRSRETGEYLFPDADIPEDPFCGWSAEQYDTRDYDLAKLDSTQGIEGVVVVLKSGEWFKLKTPWYQALHKTKDSINSTRKLFECVISEASDDLKAMFFDDPTAIKLITDMEARVGPKFNAVIAMVDKYHDDNKALDRKTYAIQGQKDLPREIFSLAMSKYLGRDIDFKEWAVKHIEWFGVKDEILTVEE